jgi:hypothetical protein
MDPMTELESKLLALPPLERERLALKAWESLVNDESAMADLGIDPDGIERAVERDAELDRGTLNPIDENEFRRRTNGST